MRKMGARTLADLVRMADVVKPKPLKRWVTTSVYVVVAARCNNCSLATADPHPYRG